MKALLVCSFALLVSGCRSYSSVEEAAANGEGESRKYSLPKQKVLELSKEVLKDAGADEFKEGDGYIIAKFYLNLVSWGSFCGVYPSEKDGVTEVRVICRRRLACGLATCLTEEGFHSKLFQKVSR